MDYLVKIRSVQTPLNGQFSIGANTQSAKPMQNDAGNLEQYQEPASNFCQASKYRKRTPAD